MNALHASILSDLAKNGPMRDVELWQHTNALSIGDVARACIALEDLGYIEKPLRGSGGIGRPVSHAYQLTEKGRQYHAQNLQGVKP